MTISSEEDVPTMGMGARTGSIAPRTAAELGAALRQAREYTLSLYAHLTEAQQRFPCIPTVNLPRWEIGHIGWFQEWWCLRRVSGDSTRPPSRWPGADALWDSGTVPHATRWSLDLPSWTDIHRYLDATLDATLTALDGIPSTPQDLYYFALALYHEDMHAEALLMTLQSLALPRPPALAPARSSTPGVRPVAPVDVFIPGGRFDLGTPARAAQHRFVFDNEKWAHPQRIAPFAIARHCVTNAAFRAFVEDDGYRRVEWWSTAGRAWRDSTGRVAPEGWQRPSGGAWHHRVFDAYEPLDPEQPVQHVNGFEAQAWCRWARRRLPTEAEWEMAARQGLPAEDDDRPWRSSGGLANLDALAGGPVAVSAFDAGEGPRPAQMLGNVWEWTASNFEPYPGFAPDAYADYSAPWFGDHVVLRGGSWATRSRLVHPRFRNFYRPERHDPFVGFRTCALDG